jgi:hypothetical protein
MSLYGGDLVDEFSDATVPGDGRLFLDWIRLDRAEEEVS